MRIVLLNIAFFYCIIAVSQTIEDDYIIYSKTIDFGVEAFDSDIEFENIGDGRLKPFEIAVVIEQMEFEFKKEHQWFNYRKGLKKKPFMDAIPDLDTTFTDHPKIITDSLKLNTLEIQSMSNDLFNELVDNSTLNYKKRWRKINRKFKHSIVFGLSKIKYAGNHASLYYWVDCGKFGYCKSEHVIVFERDKGEWQILTDFYLFMSE